EALPIVVDSATGRTGTIQPGAPVGIQVKVIQKGAGAVTFAAGAGVTLLHPDNHRRTSGPGAQVTLTHIGGDVWVLEGKTALGLQPP
ncbi:hypothetical protein WAJ14_20685, partial [Acinetobacter baumannii]